jgi:hypothetical protein
MIAGDPGDVWTWTDAGNTPGQPGNLTSASRANKQHGVIAGMMVRGCRVIVFFIAGVQ